MYYPKVLVVSNNGFSKTSSNGRTLGNLFWGWPKDRLAQFCISIEEPDISVCDNYYLLTDKNILNGFLHFKKGKRSRIDTVESVEGVTMIRHRRILKTPIKALLRHIIWCKKRWNSKEFKQWVESFNPEVVLVMNSDATFILDIARYLSKEKRIPLVMYNTEGFYFFKRNYLNPSRMLSSTFFRVYQIIYKRHFRQMMKNVVLSIHLNSLLKQDYENEFGGEHMVLYTGSGLLFDSSNLHVDNPTFSYLGNFGFNRPKALTEIAKLLQSINNSYFLDIYGKAPSKEIKDLFESTIGIRFHGMVPYNKVVDVIRDSTVLFHVESQDLEFKESLRYGFSTKIADSISSGRCFIFYSAPELAGARYIKETGAGWYASSCEELKKILTIILKDDNCRKSVLGRAKKVALENHNIQHNCFVFQQSINSVLSKEVF